MGAGVSACLRYVPARCGWGACAGGCARAGAHGRPTNSFAAARCPLLSQMKRMVVPDALRVTRLKPGRRYCLLGRISAESGWNYKELVERLEDKRKTDALEFYAKKKELAKARAEVAASVPKPAVLTDSGY